MRDVPELQHLGYQPLQPVKGAVEVPPPVEGAEHLDLLPLFHLHPDINLDLNYGDANLDANLLYILVFKLD